MSSKRSRGVIFDATCLHYFALVYRLDLLEHRYGRNAHVADEVLREIRKSVLISPELNQILLADWLQTERLVNLDDLVIFNNLLRRWGRSDRNRGEAATLVLAKRHGWAAIVDDKKYRGVRPRHTILPAMINPYFKFLSLSLKFVNFQEAKNLS